MTNKITLSIETEAPYSDKEKSELLEAFIEFMVDSDGDADQDSAEISFVDANEASDDADKKREIIEEFLKNAQIIARINIADPDGVGVEFNLD